MSSSIFNSLCKSLLAESQFRLWLKRHIPFRVKKALYKEDGQENHVKDLIFTFFFLDKSLIWFSHVLIILATVQMYNLTSVSKAANRHITICLNEKLFFMIKH